MNTGSKLLVIVIFNLLTFDFVEASQTAFASSDRELAGTRTVFDLSKIDEAVTEQLKKAWEYSRCGTTYLESLVFIYRNSDGSYRARALPPNNEFDKLTFKWDPEAIAVAHTHPNSCNPRPTANDKQLGDRYGVPMFTISAYGMYMYDPTTKATTKVQNNLDWMKASKWTRRSFEESSSSAVTKVTGRAIGGMAIRTRVPGRFELPISGGGLTLELKSGEYVIATAFHITLNGEPIAAEYKGNSFSVKRISPQGQFKENLQDLMFLRTQKPVTPAIRPADIPDDEDIIHAGISEVFCYGPGAGHEGTEVKLPFSPRLIDFDSGSDKVIDTKSKYWAIEVHNWDKTVGGMSGSPLVTNDGRVVGIVVREMEIGKKRYLLAITGSTLKKAIRDL